MHPRLGVLLLVPLAPLALVLVPVLLFRARRG
jgi:NAD kinase